MRPIAACSHPGRRPAECAKRDPDSGVSRVDIVFLCGLVLIGLAFCAADGNPVMMVLLILYMTWLVLPALAFHNALERRQ
jgi:hypothetical protein